MHEFTDGKDAVYIEIYPKHIEELIYPKLTQYRITFQFSLDTTSN